MSDVNIILKILQTALWTVPKCLRALRMIQNQGWSWTVQRRFLMCALLLQRQKKTIFCSILQQESQSGLTVRIVEVYAYIHKTKNYYRSSLCPSVDAFVSRKLASIRTETTQSQKKQDLIQSPKFSIKESQRNDTYDP